MTDGPEQVWRCPKCGATTTLKITNGAQFGISIPWAKTPCDCGVEAVLVRLDDLEIA